MDYSVQTQTEASKAICTRRLWIRYKRTLKEDRSDRIIRQLSRMKTSTGWPQEEPLPNYWKQSYWIKNHACQYIRFYVELKYGVHTIVTYIYHAWPNLWRQLLFVAPKLRYESNKISDVNALSLSLSLSVSLHYALARYIWIQLLNHL